MSQAVLEVVGYGKHILPFIHEQFCKISHNHYLLSSITRTLPLFNTLLFTYLFKH